MLVVDEMVQLGSCDAQCDKACSMTGIIQEDWCGWFGCSSACLVHGDIQHVLPAKITSGKADLITVVEAKTAKYTEVLKIMLQ